MRMKRNRVIALLIFCVIVLLAFSWLSPGITKRVRRIGKASYYVHIVQPGEKMHPNDNNALWDYQYKIVGFDALSQKKTLIFFAPKQLRQGAFLCVYVNSSDNTVISWEEIDKTALPAGLENVM